MALPVDFILIRHGESEANIMQAKLDNDDTAEMPDYFLNRSDAQMRLSAAGVEQAKATGEWLKEQNLTEYDYYYVSPHVRTRETAASLNIEGDWRVDDRWRERDWGEYGITTEKQRQKMWPISRHLRNIHKWYWSPPGGESLATDVRLRFNNIIDTLYRHKIVNEKVIGVSHGDFISVAQFVLEKMDPEDWIVPETRKKFKVHNAMVLQYSRRNPVTGEITEGDFAYRRCVVPWNMELSWDNGEWIKIAYKRHTDTDLLAAVNKYPRLFDADEKVVIKNISVLKNLVMNTMERVIYGKKR